MSPEPAQEPLLLRHGTVVLRDLIPEDVEDHVRWETVETQWMEWDAPWRHTRPRDPGEVRRSWYERVRRGPRKRRARLEVCLEDGLHLGSVNTYRVGGDSRRRAVGIGIRDHRYWGKGIGRDAFALWTKYCFDAFGHSSLYCETWSGHAAMIRLAEGLGFREVLRRENHRRVKGELADALTFAVPRGRFLRCAPGFSR